MVDWLVLLNIPWGTLTTNIKYLFLNQIKNNFPAFIEAIIYHDKTMFETTKKVVVT